MRTHRTDAQSAIGNWQNGTDAQCAHIVVNNAPVDAANRAYRQFVLFNEIIKGFFFILSHFSSRFFFFINLLFHRIEKRAREEALMTFMGTQRDELSNFMGAVSAITGAHKRQQQRQQSHSITSHADNQF